MMRIKRLKKCITRQLGIALPVTLIFLLVMAMIGITAIRNVMLEEKIAGNVRSQQLAFEAAEQVLRYCEMLVRELPQSHAETHFPLLAVGPITEGPDKGREYWESAASWTDNAMSIPLPSSILGNLNLQAVPRCMIEEIAFPGDYEFQLNPSDVSRAYRITARGIGTGSNVSLFLQSYLRL
ncbi:pilus assembly PilX family protein [Glaciimonas sp. GG7]